MDNTKLKKKEDIEYIFDKLKGELEGKVTLLQVPLRQSIAANIETLKILQSWGFEGVYICLSYPAIELVWLFEKEGLDIDKIFFIDGISRMYASKELEKNVEYIPSPMGTEAISNALRRTLSEMKAEKRFVFLDSITTVLLYNSFQQTMQFSNFITETLKQEQVLGVIISVSRGPVNDTLFNQLRKISDEIVFLE